MENASKALIIAGGVLISIIAISLFTYMYGSISTLVSSSETDYQAEEIATFNSGFEAYNKKLMYGTDVISVMNKAIDNNSNYKVTSPGEEYYVDIYFTISEKLCIVKDRYEYDEVNKRWEKIDSATVKRGNALSAGTHHIRRFSRL